MRKEILSAFKEGNLLQFIFEKSIGKDNNRDDLVPELIELHNEMSIDLISAFKELKNDTKQTYDYFTTRDILKQALPKLNAPTLSVMECVIHLLHEAGQDMAAGLICPPFIDFCASTSDRCKETLSIIEQNSEKFAELFAPTLVAGTHIDFIYFFNKTLKFIEHQDIELRRNAIFTLGRFSYPPESDIHEKAIHSLEQIVNKESDDVVLGNSIRTAFDLYKYDNSQAERIVNIITLSLSKGEDSTLHSASELLCFEIPQIPEQLLDVLLLNLQNVKPECKETLDRLDIGLEKLLKKNVEKAIDFLTKILLKHPQHLRLNIFDSVIRELYKNQNGILNKILTKWFCHGSEVLCAGITSIACLNPDASLMLKVDRSEILTKNDYIHLIFLARKTIGYLFTKPITATSIILSLIDCTVDDKAKNELKNLLFDPLLINYTGEVGDYLKSQLHQKHSEAVSNAIKSVLNDFKVYHSELKSVGIIPELNPPQSYRDTYRCHFSEIMRKAMKDAEKKSALLPFVSKYVLLYGRKLINYSYFNNGPPIRTENPLKSFENTMEFPRMTIIDPFSYSYILKIFRAEQLKQ